MTTVISLRKFSNTVNLAKLNDAVQETGPPITRHPPGRFPRFADYLNDLIDGFERLA
jgi:hypothetical protein